MKQLRFPALMGYLLTACIMIIIAIGIMMKVEMPQSTYVLLILQWISFIIDDKERKKQK